MKANTFLPLALAVPSLVSADCFGGSNKRPDHGLEVIEFFYEAACELERSPLANGGEFHKKKTTSDGKCMNVLVKNSGNENTVRSGQSVDAWAREWTGCEHGGKTSYDDKLEYM